MPWQEAYHSHGASCLNGYEYFFVSQRRPFANETFLNSLVGGEFCQRFYQQLHGNACVNRNMGADYGQWCYVSSECDDLNGGEAGHHGGLSLRHCTANDANLRYRHPRELAQMAIDQ